MMMIKMVMMIAMVVIVMMLKVMVVVVDFDGCEIGFALGSSMVER